MTRRGVGISALELELEGDGDLELEAGGFELTGDEEIEDELEEDLEAAGLDVDDTELDDAELDDTELDEPDRLGFAERLYELSLRDDELEVDHEVDTILREIEDEYFLKGLLSKASKAGRAFVKKAATVASGTPLGKVAKVATSLARGNLRGALGSLAKTALSALSAHPALAAAMPALKALGFGGAGGDGTAPWANFVELAKKSYGNLAQNLDQEAASPTGASRLAQDALRRALATTTQARSLSRSNGAGGNKRVITLRRGDRLVVRVD